MQTLQRFLQGRHSYLHCTITGHLHFSPSARSPKQNRNRTDRGSSMPWHWNLKIMITEGLFLLLCIQCQVCVILLHTCSSITFFLFHCYHSIWDTVSSSLGYCKSFQPDLPALVSSSPTHPKSCCLSGVPEDQLYPVIWSDTPCYLRGSLWGSHILDGRNPGVRPMGRLSLGTLLFPWMTHGYLSLCSFEMEFIFSSQNSPKPSVK